MENSFIIYAGDSEDAILDLAKQDILNTFCQTEVEFTDGEWPGETPTEYRVTLKIEKVTRS